MSQYAEHNHTQQQAENGGANIRGLPPFLASLHIQHIQHIQGEKFETFLRSIRTPETPEELLKSLEHQAELPLLEDHPGDWIRQLYGDMHGLGIPWTPAPPYPQFTWQEAEDELARIVTRLKQDASERLNAAKRGAPRRNRQRDRWIVSQRKKGRTCEEIHKELLELCQGKGWNPVSSPQAIHAAAVRYKSNRPSI